MRKTQGQSTLEYILLVTAVLLVFIAFAAQNNSPLKNAVKDTLGQGVDAVSSIASNFTDGHK